MEDHFRDPSALGVEVALGFVLGIESMMLPLTVREVDVRIPVSPLAQITRTEMAESKGK